MTDAAPSPVAWQPGDGEAFGWMRGGPTRAHRYLVPPVLQTIRARGERLDILDLGCGNGHFASLLAREGHRVVGVDADPAGLEIARASAPNATFLRADLDRKPLRDVLERTFDIIVSLEVIEHLPRPRMLLQRAREVSDEGSLLILSTPYHGYAKNLAISLVGGWDRHFHVERDGGHVKFFSKQSLSAVLAAERFQVDRIWGVGRVPGLWKSMIVAATPEGPP